MSVRALFIDIDDTLCTARPGAPEAPRHRGQTLLQAMIDFAVATRGLDPAAAAARVDAICDSVRWWHWSDFLLALDLDAAAFWDYAHAREKRLLGPTEPGLGRHLRALAADGWQLFITSNNPSSGICHKLRLAGLAEIWGSPLFRQYLSPCDLHCMKAEPEFWRRCLAHTGLPAAAITVVGDNPHDDVAAPRAAGIAANVLYAPRGCAVALPADVPVAASWAAIADLLASAPAPLAVGA